MQKTERIVCSALLINVDGIDVAIPIPNNTLAMDTANYIIKHAPLVAAKCNFREYFITTFGRVVDDVEGMFIAIKANQLIETAPTNVPLNSTMIRK